MTTEFVLRIRADDAASATIKKIEASLLKVSEPMDKMNRRFNKIGASGTFHLSSIEKGLSGITAATTKAIDQLSILSPGFAALGSASIVAGLTATSIKFANLGSNITRTSGLIGESKRDLQAWHVAGRAAGIGDEEMDSSLISMQNAIRGAAYGQNPAAAGILQSKGVKIDMDKNGLVENYHKAIVDTLTMLEGIKSPQGRRAAAAELGASNLLPMLEKNWRKSIDDAYKNNQIKSDGDIERGDRFKDNLRRLDESIGNLSTSIGGTLAPKVENLANSITNFINKNEESISKSVGPAIEAGAVGIGLKWLPKWLKTPGLGLALLSHTEDLNGGEEAWLAERDRREKLGLSIPPADWKKSKEYQDSVKNEGKQEYKHPATFSLSMPRGLRNNNPGNIEYGDFAKRMGAVGSDGRFAIFDSLEKGKQATDSLLESYSSRGFDTVNKIINRWAPLSENNSGAYANTVSSKIGVDPNQKLTREQLKSLAEAMYGVENGPAYKSNQDTSNTTAVQPQFNVTVLNANPGTRVEVKAPDGNQVPARVYYSMPNRY
jgi:hypothetical protein